MARARPILLSTRAICALANLALCFVVSACGSDDSTKPSSNLGGSRAQGGSSAQGGAAGFDGAGAKRGIPFTSYTPLGEPISLPGVVNASDIAWKASSDTFFVLADRVNQFYEYDSDFTRAVRTIELQNRPEDAEGLAYLGLSDGADRFALSTEAPRNEVWVFDLDPAATSLDFASALKTRFEPIAPSLVANRGLEGITLRPELGDSPAWFYACEEGEPEREAIRLFGFAYDPAGPASRSYQDGSLVIDEPWTAAAQFGARMGDLSGLHYDADSDTLLVLSHLSSRLLRVAPESGAVFDELLLARSPQYEGVTLASGGRLVLVSEPNFIEVFRSQ